MFRNAEINVVDSQTDMSSCDLNRAELSAFEEERRMEKIGKRT